MLEVFKTQEFWIMLAVVAVLVGMEALKKYLKKISTKCDKKSGKKEQRD